MEGVDARALVLGSSRLDGGGSDGNGGRDERQRGAGALRGVWLRSLLLVAALGAAALLLLLATGAPRGRASGVGLRRTELMQQYGEAKIPESHRFSDAQVLKICDGGYKHNGCDWTTKWNCPGQPKGSKGPAVDDGTMSFHCCCAEGYWRHAAVRSTTPAPAPHHGSHSSASDAPSHSTEMSPLCKVPVSQYKTSDVVQNKCNKIIRWQELARNVRPTPCHVDHVTRMMKCERDDQCEGGRNVAHHFSQVTKTLSYNCQQTCKGPLLIDCCNTCHAAQVNAVAWGYNSIECIGCANSEMRAAAQKANCHLQDGKFACATSAACEAGDPSEKTYHENYKCDVYPCDNCKTPHLKAKCCAECLSMMCRNASSTLSDHWRMACEGCDNPEAMSSWWPSWNLR